MNAALERDRGKPESGPAWGEGGPELCDISHVNCAIHRSISKCTDPVEKHEFINNDNHIGLSPAIFCSSNSAFLPMTSGFKSRIEKKRSVYIQLEHNIGRAG